MKILIIGAGMAGLAAANKLRANNHDVTILEANNQIGGRIRTDNSLGIPFDLGASWIHGTKNNPVAELATQCNVKFSPYEFYNCLFSNRTRQIISVEEFTKFHHAFDNALKTVSQFTKSTSNDMALSNALDTVIPQTHALRSQQDMWDAEIEYLGLLMGSELSRVSTRQYHEEEVLHGGNQLVVEGFVSIIERLAEGYDIQFNTAVTGVIYRHNKVEVITNQGVFQGDKVIVTVPLGVLKKEAISFDPPLPPCKKAAIENLKMGLLNKIVLKFPKTFWPEKYHNLYLSSSCTPTISLFVNYFPFFQQPILAGFVGGENAHELEKLTEQQLINKCIDNLRQHFGSIVPMPEQYLITRWSQDPFTYGSYSYIPVGASGQDYDVLAEPIENCVFFAGEATDRKHFSTVHGAYLSGIREANRILFS